MCLETERIALVVIGANNWATEAKSVSSAALNSPLLSVSCPVSVRLDA